MNLVHRYLLFAGIFGLSLVPLQCTTAMYGQTLLQDPVNENRYTFKVYVGGFAGRETADARAKVEINRYMEKNGFTSFKIISSTYNLFPSYYQYSVELKK